jgi:hypothetical protein
MLFSNAEWNYNREREKSEYLDNISVLPTSVFIFDKFVDRARPEVADEIVGHRHILRTLIIDIFKGYGVKCHFQQYFNYIVAVSSIDAEPDKTIHLPLVTDKLYP